MKILHLSEGGLPDWRIEKSAQSGKNNGHEVFFAGKSSPNYTGQIFSKIFEITWTLRARLGLPNQWMQMKKQIKIILNEIKPDIVHAHNVFSGKLISEFDYPFVYDDHEYWSVHAKFLSEIKNGEKNTTNKNQNNFFAHSLKQKLKNTIINKRAASLWSKWEEELVSSAPTITVAKKIANEHNHKGKNKKFLLYLIFQ